MVRMPDRQDRAHRRPDHALRDAGAFHVPEIGRAAAVRAHDNEIMMLALFA